MKRSDKNTEPLIALISDMGSKVVSISVAKAILLQVAPLSEVIDIAHDEENRNLIYTTYLLRSVIPNFTIPTIYVILVDIFRKPSSQMIMAEKDGNYFIAPNNGIISMVFGQEPIIIYKCFDLHHPFTFTDWMNRVGSVVKNIITKNIFQDNLHGIKVMHNVFEVYIRKNEVECSLIFIDHFGNVIINIQKKQFENIFKDKNFEIYLKNNIILDKLSNNYYDVAHNQPLCRFNNADFLELAINHGSMAQILNLTAINPDQLHYKRIKIFIK